MCRRITKQLVTATKCDYRCNVRAILLNLEQRWKLRDFKLDLSLKRRHQFPWISNSSLNAKVNTISRTTHHRAFVNDSMTLRLRVIYQKKAGSDLAELASPRNSKYPTIELRAIIHSQFKLMKFWSSLINCAPPGTETSSTLSASV